MWFKRNWELIDKTILPSGYEQMKSSTGNFKLKEASDLFVKTLVLTFKCKLTGKIKIKVIRGS
jgi:hypothetical protein